MSIRYLFSLFVGLGVTFGLFWFMNFMINSDILISSTKQDFAVMSFIRVKQEHKIAPKKREVPKEPKKPLKQPPKLKLETTTKTQIDATIKIDTPKIPLNLNLVNNGLSGANIAQSIGNIADNIAVNLMPIFKIPPTYPNRAKIFRKEGSVTLEFTITKSGFVRDIKVIEANPPKLFNKSAIKALSKWKFKPRLEGGKPVSQRARQSIDYKLNF